MSETIDQTARIMTRGCVDAHSCLLNVDIVGDQPAATTR